MVYVSTSRGLASYHRPSVQSVPLGLSILSPKRMTVCGYGGVEKGPDLYWVDWWFDLSECVDELSLTLFWDEETEVGLLIWRQFCEGLRCSLLAPDSPSDSLTGWAVAQVPEICSARGWGTQSTCLEPCLWSLGSQTHPFASLEGCGPCGMRLQLSP